MFAPRPLATCSEAVPTPPAAPCTSTLSPSLQAAAQHQREVGGVVVEDQAGALREVELGESAKVKNSGATAVSAQPPSAQNAATRSPALTAAPAGALRTTPPTSLPGTYGSGGFIWYCPRRLQQLGKGHAGDVDVDDDALARRERCDVLGLGQLDERERAVGAGLRDYLDSSHRAKYVRVRARGPRGA